MPSYYRCVSYTMVLWRFWCPRLPALSTPLTDYVPRRIALLCLVVCIARRCQIVFGFVPSGCCATLQMLMRSGVSWIEPGERFRSSLDSVVTGVAVKMQIFRPSSAVLLVSLFCESNCVGCFGFFNKSASACAGNKIWLYYTFFVCSKCSL